MAKNTEKYVIVCTRHNSYWKGIALFWAPNNAGYVSDVRKAGRYSLGEALRIYKDSRGEDFPVSETDLGDVRQYLVAECCDLDKFKDKYKGDI